MRLALRWSYCLKKGCVLPYKMCERAEPVEGLWNGASDFCMRAAMPVTQSELIYSCRSAISGLTFIARQAGMLQASTATAASSRSGAANAIGSVGLTPYR